MNIIEKLKEIDQSKYLVCECEGCDCEDGETVGIDVRPDHFEWMKKTIKKLQDENETLAAHNNDLLHEIRVLKSKINTFNKIYDEQLRIDGNGP